MNTPLRVLSAAFPRVVPPPSPPKPLSLFTMLPFAFFPLRPGRNDSRERLLSLPSLAEHCIGPHKKAFTQLIKRHHNAVRNAQFTHLVLSAAPPPSSLISFRVNLRDSYCVDFSSIHWSRRSIMTLFPVFDSIS